MGEWTGTKAALLQALFAGPADSRALAGRLAERGLQRLEAGSPEMTRNLRQMVQSGLLRTWRKRRPGSSGNRGTPYYELTSAGVAEADALRERLAGPPTAGRSGSTRAASKTVDRRLKRSLDISAVAGALRLRGARPTSRR